MMSPSKRRLRIVFAALLALSVVSVGYGVATSWTDTTFESYLDDDGDVNRTAKIAPEAGGITVIATDSNSWRGQASEGPRARAELVALNPNGTVRYYNDTHTRYWDVDPVSGTNTTVEYSYADHREGAACPDADEWNSSEYGVDDETWNTYYETHDEAGACTYNGVERVNLTTGEVETVWGQLTPGKEASRYHDVDRINDTHFVVADIYLDGVFAVNTASDEVAWRWNASDAYDPATTGGPFPEDWSHINDVEVVADGRIMVSVRNLDRAVFLTADDHTLDEAWTLGSEDDYDVLYEQHNPDLVNGSNGGPAAVVADSENNRVIEYQRTDGGGERTNSSRASSDESDGEWTQTWELGSNQDFNWPRDADRLPNGNTLVVDSNNQRVIEVTPEGDIVWEFYAPWAPFDVERMNLGDEPGGPTIADQNAEGEYTVNGSAGITPGTGDQLTFSQWLSSSFAGTVISGPVDTFANRWSKIAPWVRPVWMGPWDFVGVVGAVLLLVSWGLGELVYNRTRIRNGVRKRIA